MTAFGFNTSPAPLISASSEDSLYSKVSSGSIANGYQVLFCLTGGKGKNDNNCSGGSNIGVPVKDTWSGSFILAFSGDTAPAPLTFSDFHTRYQSTSSNGGSATGNLTQFADLTPKLVSPVPEADVWAMLIVGFGAVGFQVRRRRQRLQLRAA
ncbi:cistern family PEP-CTERM protein [Sphingomonas piscis]|uniref:Cistern family PEP-CTERM protein n=1 Tax=Sphingomonas piscis TaxID=2714943 RepID=A0A6G7YN34_9SPHN|nr:cistern family PEP-CTERM protein [Sphingomonas piscis]QIK78155.1 cistern family PEP-CTERM protein [Sphingomonas piscis]